MLGYKALVSQCQAGRKAGRKAGRQAGRVRPSPGVRWIAKINPNWSDSYLKREGI